MAAAALAPVGQTGPRVAARRATIVVVRGQKVVASTVRFLAIFVSLGIELEDFGSGSASSDNSVSVTT